MSHSNLSKLLNFFIASILLMIAYTHLLAPGTGDVPIFIEKMNMAASQGLYTAFNSQPAREYPPIASLLLLSGSYISSYFLVSDFVAFKILISLFYIASAIIIGTLSSNSIASCAFLASMFLSSIFLGYLDVFCVPFIYFGLFFLDRGRLSTGLFLFTISFLIKWQLIIFVPFILLYAFLPVGFLSGIRLFLSLDFWFILSPSLILTLFCQIFFGEGFWNSLITGLEHGKIFLSPNGLNLPYLCGMIYRELANSGEILPSIRSSLIMIREYPMIFIVFKSFFILSYLISFLCALSSGANRSRILIMAVCAFCGYVTFSTGVHENHIVMASIFSLYLAAKYQNAWPLFIATASMLNFNLTLFYLGGVRFLTQTSDYVYTLGSLFNIVAYIWIVLFARLSLQSNPPVKLSNVFIGVRRQQV